MGITVHWNAEKPKPAVTNAFSTKEQVEQTIALVKRLASDAGYEFFETKEFGYVTESTWKMLDGSTHVSYFWVGEDWTHGMYPQIRMDAIRKGEQRKESHSILVNPLNTESFELQFVEDSKEYGLFILMQGFCKTQAFSGEDASVNARSHIWIVNALCMVKRILEVLNISDESDFYEEGKELHEMDIAKIEESFDENLALINRVAEALNDEMPGISQIGVPIVREQSPPESIKSTGTPMSSKEYLYTVWEKGEAIYQETIEKEQKVVIDINIPETASRKSEFKGCDCDDCKTEVTPSGPPPDCPHLDYDDYFEKCNDCGETKERILGDEDCGTCPGFNEDVCPTCTAVGDHEESCPELEKEKSLTDLAEEMK